MPSLIPSRIVLRHSNVQGEKPTESDLLPGEVYLNIPDGKLYYKYRDNPIPIVEVQLKTDDRLLHVRDMRVDEDGNVYSVYNNGTESGILANIKSQPGRGIAIDGVVDYANQLPTETTNPPLANILNKNGTLFIVRKGLDSNSPNTLFSNPTGPRIYSYSTEPSGNPESNWTMLEGATVAASGLNGLNGNSLRSGTASTPVPSEGIDGDFYLDIQNYVLFGPKADGVWPNSGVSLIGPSGPAGESGTGGGSGLVGPTGATGAQGPPGPAGPNSITASTTSNGEAAITVLTLGATTVDSTNVNSTNVTITGTLNAPNIVKSSDSSVNNILTLTQAEFDALSSPNANTLYLIIE